jgi:hypothetical protein
MIYPHAPPQFEHKIKAQKEPWCSKVSMDKASSDNFQSYMRRVDMHQCRMGFLYGRVDEKNEVGGVMRGCTMCCVGVRQGVYMVLGWGG